MEGEGRGRKGLEIRKGKKMVGNREGGVERKGKGNKLTSI